MGGRGAVASGIGASGAWARTGRLTGAVSGAIERPGEEDGEVIFATPYANARQLIAWVLGLSEHARIIGPTELADELRERIELLVERHTGEPQIAPVAPGVSGADSDGSAAGTES